MYVIKTYWYRMSAYYVGSEYDDNGNITVKDLTEHISKATHYDDIEEAEDVCRSLNDSSYKVYPVCPICNLDYEGHPAISRHNNKMLICSECGVKEALEIFFQNKEG